MAPPAFNHQKLVGELYSEIHDYIRKKGGKCEAFTAPFMVRLNENDETFVAPDISVICDPEKLNEKGCIGAPDWIIEVVSPSDPGHDYVHKLNLYIKAGVREYWIVDPSSQMVTVYLQGEDRMAPATYTFDDSVKADIYEDLTIDFAEIKEQLK